MKRRPPSDFIWDRLRRIHLLSKSLGERAWTGFELSNALAAGQGTPARHVFLRRRTHQIEDELRLVKIAVAAEDGFADEHLAKDAAI